MSDETSLAFELPHARSVATGSDRGGDPLDRISVRDHVRQVEIGAFQSERGVTQRVRFNIVLEVARHAAAQSDDVDQVLSYDTIIEAIDEQLAAERINLLETLAERVAERVLVNPRAVRIFVRIEKLDRIPGALGVEIVRSRVTADNVVRPVTPSADVTPSEVHPLVVFLPNAVLHSDDLPGWLDSIAAHEPPAIICLEQVAGPVPRADVAAASRRISLLAIEQNAWILAGKDRRCVVVDSRTELEWAMKHGQMSVWAPSKLVLDARDGPWDETPLGLARWFARSFSAQSLVLAGGFGSETTDDMQRVVTAPEDL